MLLAIQRVINAQSLFIEFFRNRLLFNTTKGVAKVEITFSYRGMPLAVNNFLNDKRLLMVFFSLIKLTKVTANISHKSLF